MSVTFLFISVTILEKSFFSFYSTLTYCWDLPSTDPDITVGDKQLTITLAEITAALSIVIDNCDVSFSVVNDRVTAPRTHASNRVREEIWMSRHLVGRVLTWLRHTLLYIVVTVHYCFIMQSRNSHNLRVTMFSISTTGGGQYEARKNVPLVGGPLPRKGTPSLL